MFILKYFREAFFIDQTSTANKIKSTLNIVYLLTSFRAVNMDLFLTPKLPKDDDDQFDEEDIDEPHLLPADHPLMERFQRALREHLLKVKNQLEGEISDINHAIREKNEEVGEVGAKLFDLQSEIEKQRETLEKYNKQILDVSEKRRAHEENAAKFKTEFYRKEASCKELKRRNNLMAQEIESMKSLESEITKWNMEIQNEIALAKRVATKDSKDQKLVSEEKKKIDMLLFNLDSEVRKKEIELENVEEQIKEHSEAVSELNQSLADSNVDLEGLQQEHKKLMQAWGEVIVAVQHRDKILSKARMDLQ